MPRVPTYDNLTATIDVPTGPKASVAAFGGDQAKALSDAGEALGKASNVITNYVVQEQKLLNETEAKDGMINFDRGASDLTIEFNSLQGNLPAKKFAEYREKLENLRKESLAKASNPAVARQLDFAFSDRYERLLRSGSQHVASQMQDYSREQDKAMLTIKQDQSKRVGDDDKEAARLRGEIDDLWDKQVIKNGMPPEAAEVEKKKFWQNSLMERINVFAVDNPAKAKTYLDHYRNDLDPSQAAALGEQIGRQIDDENIRKGTDRIKNGIDPLTGKGMKDFIAKAEGTEGRGDGGKGYNVSLDHGTWLPGGKEMILTNKTLKEVRALQEYMLSQPANRAKYGSGNLRGSSAMGRYQIVGDTLQGLMDQMRLTGEEKFDEAMQDKMADVLLARRGGDPASLKKEWQGLNRRTNAEITAALNQRGEVLPRLTPDLDKPGLDRMVAHAEKVAEAEKPGDLKYKERYVKDITGEYAMIKRQQEEKEGQEYDYLVGKVIGEPETSGITNFNQLDPKDQARINALPKTRQEALRNRIESNQRQVAAGEKKLDQGDINKFEEMHGLWASNYQEFLKRDILSLNLPSNLTNKLVQMRLAGPKEEEDIRVGRAMRTNAKLFQSLKLKPDKYNELQGKMLNELNRWRGENKGKYPTDEELMKMGEKLTTEFDVDPSYWPGIPEFLGGEKYFQGRAFQAGFLDIPAGDKDRIIRELGAKGRTGLQEADILDTWLDSKYHEAQEAKKPKP